MSGLPYKFEPGMCVLVAESEPGIVTGINAYGDVSICHDGSLYLWSRASCMADLDHPGTRGLLLQQYRDASGHECATVVWADGHDQWIVDLDPYQPDDELPPAELDANIAGRGESEGAAILDALTRLAAEQRLAPGQAKSVEGSEAIVRALFEAERGAMEKMAERLAAVESMLIRAEARIIQLEGKAGQ